MVGNVHIEGLVSSLKMTCPTISDKLIRAFLFDELFMLVSRTQILWKPAFGVRVPMPLHSTFFTMAPSGGGKGQIQSLMKVLFGDYLKAYAEDVETGKKKHNDLMLEESKSQSKKELGIKGKGYFEDLGEKDKMRLDKHARELYQSKQANGFVKMNTQIGSVQGVAHALDCMRTLKIGSYCQRIDECASIITSTTPAIQDFITTLLSFSGGATELGRSLKAEILDLSAEGVATNIHMFGNTEGFKESPKSLTVFRRFLKQGFSRRGFFTHVTEKIKITEDSLLAEIDSTNLNEWGEFFKRQYDFLKGCNGFNFDFTQDARKYIAGVHAHITNTKNENDTERGDHTFKAQKLSCIFAMLESTLTVEKRHLEEAMFYIEQSAQDYLSLLGEVEEEVLNNTDSYDFQMMRALLEIDNPIPKKLLSRKLTPQLKKTSGAEWESILEATNRNLQEEGYYLHREPTANKRGECYIAKKLEVVEDSIVSFSLCEAKTQNGYSMVKPFIWQDNIKFKEAIEASKKGNYSAGRFKDEYRDGKNWLGGNTMLIYDVDSGTTIEEAKSMFLDTACAIMPTKSHQKEKNGVVRDRFRVFLPLANPIDFTDADRFKRIMKNVADTFNLQYDEQTKDTARMFYPASQESISNCWFSREGSRFIDFKLFDYDTMSDENLKTVYNFHNATFRANSQDKAYVERSVRKLCDSHYREGNRNNTLFRAMRWLRDSSFTQQEAELLMQEITSSSPLPLDEWKATVRSAWR